MAGILQEQTDWSGYQASINNGTVVEQSMDSWICATITSSRSRQNRKETGLLQNMPKIK